MKTLSTVKTFSSTVMQPHSPPLVLRGPSDKSPVNTDRLAHQVLTVESFHGCLGLLVCLILHQCIALSTVSVNIMLYIFSSDSVQTRLYTSCCKTCFECNAATLCLNGKALKNTACTFNCLWININVRFWAGDIVSVKFIFRNFVCEISH